MAVTEENITFFLEHLESCYSANASQEEAPALLHQLTTIPLSSACALAILGNPSSFPPNTISVTLFFLRHAYGFRSSFIRRHVSDFQPLFHDFLNLFSSLATAPALPPVFPTWSRSLLARCCTVLGAGAARPEILALAQNLLSRASSQCICSGLSLLSGLFSQGADPELLQTLQQFTSLYFGADPFSRPDRLLILANVFSIWEVAIAGSTDLFPRDGGEWHILIAVLLNEQTPAPVLWRAMRCTSTFYKAFQRAGDATRFQEFVELFAQPILCLCMSPPVILGEAARSQCRILLAVLHDYFKEIPEFLLSHFLTISLAHLALPPTELAEDLESNPRTFWGTAYEMGSDYLDSSSRVLAFSLLNRCFHDFPEASFEWLRVQADSEPLMFSFWGVAKCLKDLTPLAVDRIRAIQVPDELFLQLTHSLMLSAYVTWLEPGEIAALRQKSFLLMQHFDEPLLYTMGALVMQELACVTEFADDHIELLSHGIVSDIGMSSLRVLGQIALRRPMLPVLHHFCHALDEELDQAFNTHKPARFHEICQICSEFIQQNQTPPDVIERLGNMTIRILNDSDIHEALINTCPIIQLLIVQGVKGTPFVEAFIEAADADCNPYIFEIAQIFTVFVAADPEAASPFARKMLDLTIALCDADDTESNDEHPENCAVMLLMAAMVQTGILPDGAAEMAVRRAMVFVNEGSLCFCSAVLLLGSMAIADEQYFEAFARGVDLQRWIAEIQRGAFSGNDLRVLAVILLRKIADSGENIREIAEALAANQLPYNPQLELIVPLPFTRNADQIPGFLI
jgi:hypothetical protein